jgi:phenylacetate-CoA ligase
MFVRDQHVILMFNKPLFILAHEIGCSRFYSDYKQVMKNQWKPYQELKKEQDMKLQHMITFCYENVPYYHTTFKNSGLNPDDIKIVEDLEKLPVLTKDTIKHHWNEFKPFTLSKMKYSTGATGGTTGTPFYYRLSKHDRFLSGALLYRGWGYGGYDLGDKMVFLAGSSLDIGAKSTMGKFAHEFVRNLKKLSSFDMGEKEMREYVHIINSFKPKYIRGYASSIYFFASWIEERNLNISSPAAVFSTAENLYPNMREKIAEVFDCEVYDAYGLNDGGVGAYECPEHTGLHIDTERSIMEVVDHEGHQMHCGEGRILATSLHNYAMPFIRYETGDEGHIIDDVCSCGRGHQLLKKITGRSTDIFFTPEGNKVHGWFFLYIFWDYGHGMKEYQVIQETLNTIIIKIVPDKNFDKKQLDFIRELIKKRSSGWNIEFQCVDKIERSSAGKYKFIINKLVK